MTLKHFRILIEYAFETLEPFKIFVVFEEKREKQSPTPTKKDPKQLFNS